MLNKNNLKDQQSTGEWPAFESDLLKTKYSNRWEKAGELFQLMTSELFEDLNVFEEEKPQITEWKDEDLPNKIYSTRHEGPTFGFDIDYMAGPHDWEHEDDPIGDYVMRKKL